MRKQQPSLLPEPPKKKKGEGGRVFVGDFIMTNENFKPKTADGSEIDLTQTPFLLGIVLWRKGDTYGVKLGPGLPWTNHLDGLLSSPEGYELERDDFDIFDV